MQVSVVSAHSTPKTTHMSSSAGVVLPAPEERKRRRIQMAAGSWKRSSRRV